MRALICGISGQDGALLARFLLDKGYEVIGTSRDAQISSLRNLKRVKVAVNEVTLSSMAPNDFRSVLQTIKRFAPTEIYNLSGQSSVGLSFDQPVETQESIATATHNFLEALRFLDSSTKFYNAGSSECFGDTPPEGANESTPFRPRSPYGVAKSTAYWQVANYREAYGVRVCTGILFNHESPLRPARFVTRKIVSTACRIRAGSDERLRLGNLSVLRDWGYAPDFVRAMWQMLNIDGPMEDFVIATGKSHPLEEFVALTFAQLGLDWRDHTDVDESLYRPTDIAFSLGDPSKAHRVLGWIAETKFEELISSLVKSEREAAGI
ncbi:MAG: GDP-mannose 4,6-dehydratase [Gammaproteobacteria bacterium]|nr:GDP-mannose 4,6-dehydratase [Gammaproteobacteria bacterium]